jgi:hypothetical protein
MEDRQQGRARWQRVGRCHADGFLRSLYTARVPIPCWSCGRIIAVGEHFTRRQPADQAGGTHPYCATCRPFVETPER